MKTAIARLALGSILLLGTGAHAGVYFRGENDKGLTKVQQAIIGAVESEFREMMRNRVFQEQCASYWEDYPGAQETEYHGTLVFTEELNPSNMIEVKYEYNSYEPTDIEVTVVKTDSLKSCNQ